MTETSSDPGKKPKRFRISSVLLVLAVLALIAWIVMPALYVDARDRSQVAEAAGLMSGARTALTEFYANQGAWPAKLEDVATPLSGRYTGSIRISRGGGKSPALELTATLKTEGTHRDIAGRTLRLYTEDGGKNWTCRAGTLPERTVPLSCRSSS